MLERILPTHSDTFYLGVAPDGLLLDTRAGIHANTRLHCWPCAVLSTLWQLRQRCDCSVNATYWDATFGMQRKFGKNREKLLTRSAQPR